MPTYELLPRFLDDLDRLTPEQRRRLKLAIDKFVEDLRARRPPRRGLGVKGLQGYEGIYEFRFAGDGRALFMYGTSPHPGDVHVIWLRVGTHDIYATPHGA
jgi:mRNA-degrading endonuclease RelE of RelBE toxin-antitoxin system